MNKAQLSALMRLQRDLDKALAAGVDDIAHMIRDTLSDEVIDQMIARNVYFVPTLKIFSLLGLASLNDDNLQRFVAAGGEVAVGTDYNNPRFPEDMYLLEMEMMQDARISPMQIIIAATKNGAMQPGE